MTKPLPFLLLAFSLCFAQPKTADVDSLKEAVKILKAEQTENKKSLDSLNSKFLSDNFISVKGLKEIQELYNIAFDKMQSSFSTFTNRVLVIITILGFFIAALSLINFLSSNSLRKDVRKELDKIKNFEKELEELRKQFNEEMDKHKTEFSNIKQENKESLENERMIIIDKFNLVYRKLAEIGFSSAEGKIASKDWFLHFADLGGFYFILSKMTVLTDYDIYSLNATRKFLNEYKNITFSDKNFVPKGQFFHSLLQITESSEKINPNLHIEAKSIYNELLKIFTYDKVKKTIEEYLNYLNDMRYPIEFIQKVPILMERYRDKQ